MRQTSSCASDSAESVLGTHLVRSRHCVDGHDAATALATLGAVAQRRMLVSHVAVLEQKPSWIML